MKPLTKLYLKIFFFTSIPYGLIMIGFDLLNGYGFQTWKYLLSASLFGMAMSFILGYFHKSSLKKNGMDEVSDNALGVTQTKVIRTELSKGDLINKLKANPKTGKMKMSATDDGIILKTSLSWKSWGEEIMIALKSKDDLGYEYQVSSKPKLSTTLVDYGKNLENINQIESVISIMA